MAQGTTISKQRLSITNVEMDVPYSQGTKQLDRVHAVNLSLPEGDPLAGKDLRLTIFNGDLKTFVRGKTNIVADIEERPRPESDYGPDRTITQVYDDKGQPVSRKQFGGGGGWKGRSLEDDLALEQVKRRSIEGQTSVAQVGFLVLAVVQGSSMEGVGIDAETFKRLEGKYWQAVERGLDNYLATPPKTQAAKSSQGTASKAADKPQDTKPGAQAADKVSKDPPPTTDPIKHVGDLLTRAGKLKPPVNPAEVATACGVTRTDEIKDLEECWKKVQEFSVSKGGEEGAKLFD